VLRVGDHRELQAAVLALKQLPRDLRLDINKATRDVMNGPWKQAVEAHATSPMASRVLATGARIKAGNPPVAQAATSSRAIGRDRRIRPVDVWPGYEFGANRNVYSRYKRTSPNGKVHTVERRTQRHLPNRNRKGYAVYPAFAEMAPRVTSLWVQIIVRKTYDAFEGK